MCKTGGWALVEKSTDSRLRGMIPLSYLRKSSPPPLPPPPSLSFGSKSAVLSSLGFHFYKIFFSLNQLPIPLDLFRVRDVLHTSSHSLRNATSRTLCQSSVALRTRWTGEQISPKSHSLCRCGHERRHR
jgi:hypothetical protein